MNGRSFKALRVEYGFSQIELAERFMVDQATISRIENNKQDISLSVLKKMRFLYDLTDKELVSFIEGSSK